MANSAAFSIERSKYFLDLNLKILIVTAIAVTCAIYAAFLPYSNITFKMSGKEWRSRPDLILIRKLDKMATLGFVYLSIFIMFQPLLGFKKLKILWFRIGLPFFFWPFIHLIISEMTFFSKKSPIIRIGILNLGFLITVLITIKKLANLLKELTFPNPLRRILLSVVGIFCIIAIYSLFLLDFFWYDQHSDFVRALLRLFVHQGIMILLSTTFRSFALELSNYIEPRNVYILMVPIRLIDSFYGRLVIIKMRSSLNLTITALCVSLIEVLKRNTIVIRTNIILKIYRKLGWHNDTLQDIYRQNIQQIAGDLINWDMIVEIISIITVSSFFFFYNAYDNRLVTDLCIQLGIEVVTDYFCIYLEEKKFELTLKWNTRHKHFTRYIAVFVFIYVRLFNMKLSEMIAIVKNYKEPQDLDVT